MTIDILFQYAWIFPIYSFFGWCLEVIYCSVNTGRFVNRGFLNGAACPIYGVGACFLISSLTPVQDNLFLLYFGSVLIGSLLELIGGFLLKKIFHMSWWDYCDQPMNIGGYICLKFSLGWGVVGVVLMRVIHPPVLGVVSIIPTFPLAVLLILFYVSFIADLIITVLVVLKLYRDIQEISRLSALLHKSSDRIAEGIGNTALNAAGRIKEMDIAGITERVQSAVEDNLEKIHDRLEQSERLNTLLNNRNAMRLRLLKAFPRLKDIRNNKTFYEMKQHIKNSIKSAGDDDENL